MPFFHIILYNLNNGPITIIKKQKINMHKGYTEHLLTLLHNPVLIYSIYLFKTFTDKLYWLMITLRLMHANWANWFGTG